MNGYNDTISPNDKYIKKKYSDEHKIYGDSKIIEFMCTVYFI